MAHRGIALSQEKVRQWSLDSAMECANKIRRHKPKPESTWHLDDVLLKFSAEQDYLWRAVAEYGAEVDIKDRIG